MLHGKWWEIYNDAELNALEDKLSVDNQTIKQSFENFMAARALVAEARSQLYPTVGTTPSGQRSESSANTGSGTNKQSDLLSLPFDVSWTPDLWGKVRNQIREQQYNAQISAADLENVRLSEQASLAITFFLIRGQDALQAVLQQTVVDDQKSLDYTRAQYETGVGTELSVVEAENTLQNAQSLLLNVGVSRSQYEHAIATLIGTDASSFSIPVKPLNAAPPAVPIGVPSRLLERRPDIAASERQMASANAAIGVATAAFYPTLTLSASGGLQSSAIQQLFKWSSRFWSVGDSISETIYDGGLRRATVRQFTATYNADVAGYRQTVLTAFQQVEDYLRRGPHPVAAGPAATARGPIGPALRRRTGAGALPDRHRPVHRRGHGAEYAAQRSANPGEPAHPGDDVLRPVDRSPRRRMGQHSAPNPRTSLRQTNSRGDHDPEVAWPKSGHAAFPGACPDLRRAAVYKSLLMGGAPIRPCDCSPPHGEGAWTMQVTTATSDALQRYLDLASDQMKLTAENMANVDTPGYRTQGFDFAQEFSRALGGSEAGKTPVKVTAVDGLTARPDGNNVSLDREGIQLAKAQLEFRTGVSLLKTEYTRVMSAIHADK